MTTNKKSTRYYSRKQEDTIAKRLDGKVVANSGATTFRKGDVRLDDWLIEAKTKVSPSDSISVKRAWLEKNEAEAFSQGKHHSAVAINFGDKHTITNYYIISEKEFKRLLQYEKEDI